MGLLKDALVKTIKDIDSAFTEASLLFSFLISIAAFLVWDYGSITRGSFCFL